MRKLLELASLLAVAFLCWITYDALYGPKPITGVIPTHFDLAGHPNHYGSPQSLQILAAAGIGLYLLTTLISQFPRAFNYPVRITEENRPRLQRLAQDMLAWMKTEILILFAVLQHSIIDSVRHGAAALNPLPIFLFLPITAITTAWYISAMRRAR
jgi:hypothetical protein